METSKRLGVKIQTIMRWRPLTVNEEQNNSNKWVYMIWIFTKLKIKLYQLNK